MTRARLVLGAHGFKAETWLSVDDSPSPTIGATGYGRYSYWITPDEDLTVKPKSTKRRPISSSNKPPFSIPTMEEIRAIPWNGLKVASTFSGAGGSCTGYRMAGYKVVWANEFVPAAQETYRANASPDSFLDTRDIRIVKASEILEQTGLKVGELDLFDGSPPCQAFSMAGKRSKGWGTSKKYEHGAEQKNETLFDEYIRLLRGLRPKVFVAENVSGLVRGVAKGYFLEILKAMKESGYRVVCKLCDAQWLGVPQMRLRTIFIGVREDLKIDPVHPTPLSYRYSIRDALPWIGQVVHDTAGHQSFSIGECTDTPCPAVLAGRNNFQVSTPDSPAADRNDVEVIIGNSSFRTEYGPPDTPSPTIMAGGPGKTSGFVRQRAPQQLATDAEPSSYAPIPSRMKPTGYAVRDLNPNEPSPTVTAQGSNDMYAPNDPEAYDPDTDISRYAIGDDWDNLKPGERSKKYIQNKRAHPDEPIPTVTSSSGNYPSSAQSLHPYKKRKFTIAEIRRLCAFPDDFVLTGSYGQQWERLGNSVPPVMMYHIAKTIRDTVFADR